MPEPISIVPCPGCQAKLKVPAKRAVRCPKCSAVVRSPEAEGRVRPPSKPPAKREDPDGVEALEEVEDEPRPKRRRDEDDDRPRSRRRDDDDDRPRRRPRDDDEDDDRPKRRRGRGSDEGPWVIAAAAGGGGFVLMFLGGFLVNGMRGVTPSPDGYSAQVGGLGLLFLFSLVLIPFGVLGVKDKRTYDRWGWAIEGSSAVLLGFIQSVGGGLLGGFALYGLITTLAQGR